MATQSSVLAWRIPGMPEPGGLPSLGSQSLTRLKRLSSSSRSSMWYLSSLTRDGIRTPCIRRWSLSHWITREVPNSLLERYLVYQLLWFIFSFMLYAWNKLSWNLRNSKEAHTYTLVFSDSKIDFYGSSLVCSSEVWLKTKSEVKSRQIGPRSSAGWYI